MYINSFAAVFNKFLRMARQKGKEPTEKKSLQAGSKKKPIPRKTAVFSSDDEEKEGGALRIDDSDGEEEEEEQPDTSDREFLNDSEPEYADSSDPLEAILSDDSADFVQKKPTRPSKAGNKSVASKKKAVTPPATSDDYSEDFVQKKSRPSKSVSKPTRAKAPSSPRNEDETARQAKTVKRQSLSKEQQRSKSLTASPRASSAPVEEEEESSDELEEEPLVGTKRPRKKSGGPIKKKKATERPRIHDASSILKDKLKSLGQFQLPVSSLVPPRYQVPG